MPPTRTRIFTNRAGIQKNVKVRFVLACGVISTGRWRRDWSRTNSRLRCSSTRRIARPRADCASGASRCCSPVDDREQRGFLPSIGAEAVARGLSVPLIVDGEPPG